MRWVALLLLLAAAAAAAPLDAAFVEWSLGTCRSDPVCAARFRLPAEVGVLEAYDTARFGEMLAMMVARQQDGGDVGATAVLGACVAEPGAPGCSMAQWMWLAMLRQARVCGENEEWVVGHGCSCLDGKHCASEYDNDDINDLWPFTLAVAIIGVFMLVIVVWDTRKSNEMERLATKRFADSLVAHYTLQAQLFLAEPQAPPAVVSSIRI
jgi:hypothetical protein